MPAAGSVTITIEGKDGSVQILKEGPEFQVGKVIDATSMNATTIKEFFAKEIQDCYEKKLAISLYKDATMMVYDPILWSLHQGLLQ